MSGSSARSSAATPETYGAAIDVPAIQSWPSSPTVDRTPSEKSSVRSPPGATRSTYRFVVLYRARTPSRVTAPTETTPLQEAGTLGSPAWPGSSSALPEAATTSTPAARASSTTAW